MLKEILNTVERPFSIPNLWERNFLRCRIVSLLEVSMYGKSSGGRTAHSVDDLKGCFRNLMVKLTTYSDSFALYGSR
jgi:hypothetical protein